MEKYYDIWLLVEPVQIGQAAELLLRAGSSGVVEEAVEDGLVRVQGAVPLRMKEIAWASVEKALAEEWIQPGGREPQMGGSPTPELDWKAMLRHHHRPFSVHGVHIRPPWSEPVSSQDIVLDSGPAFGTGGHETTRFCLEELGASLLGPHKGTRLLDVGTGSGILALLAAKLRPDLEIHACDIDSDALEFARESAENNNLHERIHFVNARPHSRLGRFDWVVANLEWPIFQKELPAISTLVLPGGLLLCSGLLNEQREAFLIFAEEQGLVFLHAKTGQEWCVVLLQKE